MSQLPKAFVSPHTLSGTPSSTPLLLALSGGADSCALLYMLLEYCAEHGTPLSVAHVDHGIRGEEAKRDADFCCALAKRHGLPFYLLNADVPALAKQNGRSVEEEARAVRYDFFEQVMQRESIPLLVTAHNADDNAETVLFRISRGTTARGLSGIPSVRALSFGAVVRPLLDMTKAEILAYCEENAIDFVNDCTNECTLYARNRIRHHVLPELRAVNDGVAQNINRLSRSLRAEEDFWREQVEVFLAANADKKTLCVSPLLSLHEALGKRVLATFLETNGIEPSFTTIELVFSLARAAKPHASLDFAGGTISYENGMLVANRPLPQKADYLVPVQKEMTSLLDGEFCLIREDPSADGVHQMCQNIYKKSTTTKISSATINGSLFVRPRREGDTILTGGMHKKVKKLFCEKKIPLPLRDRLPILCDDDGIVWIPLVALRDGVGGDTDRFTLFYNENPL